VGGTTRRTLFLCKRGDKNWTEGKGMGAGKAVDGAPPADETESHSGSSGTAPRRAIAPFAGGEWDFERNPDNAANGRYEASVACTHRLALSTSADHRVCVHQLDEERRGGGDLRRRGPRS
jgi:hypothetical protein